MILNQLLRVLGPKIVLQHYLPNPDLSLVSGATFVRGKGRTIRWCARWNNLLGDTIPPRNALVRDEAL